MNTVEAGTLFALVIAASVAGATNLAGALTTEIAAAVALITG